MIPEANALMIENALESGLRAGMDCVSSGRHTPIMLVNKIIAIAMRLSFKALDLSWHPCVDSVPQWDSLETFNAKDKRREKEKEWI